MSSFEIFRLEFQKTIVVFETSTLEVVKNQFLIHTVNFCIESTFSKDPRSAFFEGQGLGLGTLYKNCPFSCIIQETDETTY